MKSLSIIPAIAIFLVAFGCKKDAAPKFAQLFAINDGFITNSNPKTITEYYDGLCGRNIQIGWTNSGDAMRGFISFDISQILPSEEEKLNLLNVELNVYECNTNLHPFDGDGGTRGVEVYLLDYRNLHVDDFNANAVANCGIIASWGYNVLEEYALNITEIAKSYYNEDPLKRTRLQFRMQFTNDQNITNTDSSDLDGSIWSFFAEEETSYNEISASLNIEYEYKEN